MAFSTKWILFITAALHEIANQIKSRLLVLEIALAGQNHLHRNNEMGRANQGHEIWSTSWHPSDP